MRLSPLKKIPPPSGSTDASSHTLLADGFAEAKSNRCVFDINGLVLEKVCEYLYYNEKHKDAKDVPDMDVPPELCLELLMAADYLNGMWPTSQCPR